MTPDKLYSNEFKMNAVKLNNQSDIWSSHLSESNMISTFVSIKALLLSIGISYPDLSK